MEFSLNYSFKDRSVKYKRKRIFISSKLIMYLLPQQHKFDEVRVDYGKEITCLRRVLDIMRDTLSILMYETIMSIP